MRISSSSFKNNLLSTRVDYSFLAVNPSRRQKRLAVNLGIPPLLFEEGNPEIFHKHAHMEKLQNDRKALLERLAHGYKQTPEFKKIHEEILKSSEGQ